MKARLGAAALLVAVVAAVALAARGPDPAATPTAQAVEARVMSSWCPGLTLAECPSAQAADLRREIAAKVAGGWTNERIDAWLVANYGEGVLGRPRGMAPFLVPAAVVLAGGVVVALVLRGRRTGDALPGPAEAPAGEGSPEADAAWRERLDADLRRFAGEATE